MYYFGYGSNMARRTMDRVCPGHEIIGAARLDGYRLAFTRFSATWNGGVADIVQAEHQAVWGRLYRVDEACMTALDIKESLGVGYDRIEVEVVTVDDERYTVITYAVIVKSAEEFPAAPEYKATILEGAGEAQFPPAYITFLNSIKITGNDQP